MNLPTYLYEDVSLTFLVHKYWDMLLKRKKLNLKIWFNQQCLHNNLRPKYISLRSNSNCRSSRQALEAATKVWISGEIKSAYNELNTVNATLLSLYFKLNNLLHIFQFNVLDRDLRDRLSNESIFLFRNLRNKLSILKKTQHSSASGSKKPFRSTNDFRFHPRVLNLSDTVFNQKEMRFMNKGLNFNTFCNDKNSIITTTAVESEHVIKDRIVGEKGYKDHLRTEISDILTNWSKGNFRFSKTQIAIIKSLKSKIKNDDLVISKADKGNCILL